MLRQLILVTVLGLVVAGCSSKPKPVETIGTLAEPASGSVSVSIEDFAFHPKTLVVKKGTVLTVTNDDVASHSLTAEDRSFDTTILGLNKSATITLDKAGTFKVFCIPHPDRITGTITVVE